MCGYTECCSRCIKQEPTVGITTTLLHKVLDYVQVAIDTGQREWGVSSLVHCSYILGNKRYIYRLWLFSACTFRGGSRIIERVVRFCTLLTRV